MDWPFRGRTGELQRARRALTGSPQRGVVIAGPPYVGRTRLLDELTAVLPGRAHRATATRGTREVAFACLGALAPPSRDRPERWVEELRERAGDGAILVLDDAQWADPLTGQLLLQVARAGAPRLLVAVRTGHRVPGAVTTLWKDGLAERIDLAPLDRAASDELIDAVLAGHVATAVRHELWDLSRGYPLVLREFLEDAVATGAIAREEGVWVGTRPLQAPRRYVDLTSQVLSDLPAEVGEVIRLVALGEPLEPAVLDALAPPETVAALERGGIVVQDASTGRYRISVPGARMALRAGIEPSVMRALSNRLSSTMVDRRLHEDDLIRFALWRLDAGDTTDNSLFVRAAERAASVFDHELTERLSRAALPRGGIEAEILLANALIHQRRHEEAERHLAVAAEMASDDVELARVAGLRSQVLFHRLGRMDEGIAILDQACEDVDDEDVRDQLRGALALLRSMQGDLPAALELCGLVLDRPDAEPPAKVVAATSASFAAVLRGDLEHGRRLAEDHLALSAPGVERDYPMARPMLSFILMLAQSYLGDFDAAEARARRGHAAALEDGADEVAGVWASQLAGLLVWRGRIHDAVPLAAEGRRLLSRADPMGVRTLAYAIGATALAEAGDADGVERLLDGLRGARTVTDLRSRLLEQRATAMGYAARGETARAVDLLSASTELALQHEHWTWGAFTAYHTVRYGQPGRRAEVLHEAARRGGGRLLPAIAAHAQALGDRDVPGLDRAAEQLARVGAVLWAAEAYAQAAGMASGGGDGAQASVLRARAVALAQRCPGAMTPAIRGLRVTPLTRREHEVATLAANGLTSPQIAERLVVSVRTVDNHLASVYRKLDISGRDQLPAALAVDL